MPESPEATNTFPSDNVIRAQLHALKDSISKEVERERTKEQLAQELAGKINRVISGPDETYGSLTKIPNLRLEGFSPKQSLQSVLEVSKKHLRRDITDRYNLSIDPKYLRQNYREKWIEFNVLVAPKPRSRHIKA